MCLTLYIGSDQELKQIEWNIEHPALNAVPLGEFDEKAKVIFSAANLLSIGSDQGCGCGFRHALVQGDEWLIVEEDDLKETQRNHRELVDYIKNVGGDIEIYACWNGDIPDEPQSIEEIKINDILEEDFYFKENGLYRVRV